MNPLQSVLFTRSIFSKISAVSWRTCGNTYSRLRISRYLSKNTNDDSQDRDFKSLEQNLTSPISALENYDEFRDEDAPIILDVQEEKLKALEEEQKPDKLFGMSIKRGVEGVFDIQDLIELLRRDQAVDIFVARVPPDIKYVNYIVVVSGRSPRHMAAMAEFVRRVYKKRRNSTDFIPKIEGEDSKNWIAMDLGNIALHIFSHKTRKVYDLESLWSLGSEYDDHFNEPEDPVIELLLKHSVYLGDLKPANTKQ